MVVDRVVAVIDVSVAVEVEVAGVAGRPLGRTVGEFRVVGIGLGLLVALEEPVAAVAPDFAQGHPFVIADLVVGGQGSGFACVAGDLAGVVPDGELDVVAQGLAAYRVRIAPRDAGLPSVGVHVGVVAFGGVVAVDGRKLVAHDVHVGGLLAVDVGREVQPSVECLEVQSEVIGRGRLPGQPVGDG